MTYRLIGFHLQFNNSKVPWKEAKQNMHGLRAGIPERMLLLTALIRTRVPEWEPNYSEESLSTLGEWMQGVITVVEIPKNARTFVRSQLKSPLQFLADRDRKMPTDEAKSLGVDAALYLGECLRYRCPEARWIVPKRNVGTLNKHALVLTGFSEYNLYNAIGHGIKAAESIAAKVFPPKPIAADKLSEPEGEIAKIMFDNLRPVCPEKYFVSQMEFYLSHRAVVTSDMISKMTR